MIEVEVSECGRWIRDGGRIYKRTVLPPGVGYHLLTDDVPAEEKEAKKRGGRKKKAA